MLALASPANSGREKFASDDWLTRKLAEIARFVREATPRGVRGRYYDGLEAEARELARNERSPEAGDHKD